MSEQFYANAYQTRLATRVLRHDDAGLILEDTLCYPLGGSQPGDSAALTLADRSALRIADTRRDRETRAILHQTAGDARLAPGTEVTLELDWDRRYRHMRIHTCLHLLGVVVKAGVTGGNMTAESGRLTSRCPRAWSWTRKTSRPN